MRRAGTFRLFQGNSKLLDFCQTFHQSLILSSYVSFHLLYYQICNINKMLSRSCLLTSMSCGQTTTNIRKLKRKEKTNHTSTLKTANNKLARHTDFLA